MRRQTAWIVLSSAVLAALAASNAVADRYVVTLDEGARDEPATGRPHRLP